MDGAENAVVAEGIHITNEMRKRAEEKARLSGTDPQQMEQHARRSLRADAAAIAAITEAKAEGQGFTSLHIENARIAAFAICTDDFKAMRERALRELLHDKEFTYVASITGYKKAGLEVELSFSLMVTLFNLGLAGICQFRKWQMRFVFCIAQKGTKLL